MAGSISAAVCASGFQGDVTFTVTIFPLSFFGTNTIAYFLRTTTTTKELKKIQLSPSLFVC